MEIVRIPIINHGKSEELPIVKNITEITLYSNENLIVKKGEVVWLQTGVSINIPDSHIGVVESFDDVEPVNIPNDIMTDLLVTVKSENKDRDIKEGDMVGFLVIQNVKKFKKEED